MNKNWLAKLVLVGAMLFSSAGCFGIGAGQRRNPGYQKLILGWDAELGGNFRRAGFKETKPKEIPVHPSDACFLRGTTKINTGGKLVNDFPFHLKGSLEAGVKTISCFGGFEFIYSVSLENSDGSQLYSLKQQASDARDPGSGSFVYDKIGLCPSCGPIFGVHMRPIADLELSLIGGLPIETMTREWGHHRWGYEERIGKERDSATGWKIGGEAIYYWFAGGELDDLKVGGGIYAEHRKVPFKISETESNSVGFKVKIKF